MVHKNKGLFPYLQLPTELRVMIYNLVLTSTDVICIDPVDVPARILSRFRKTTESFEHRTRGKIWCPALLAANRPIHDECGAILYNNHFSIAAGIVTEFLRSIPHSRHLISTITLDVVLYPNRNLDWDLLYSASISSTVEIGGRPFTLGQLTAEELAELVEIPDFEERAPARTFGHLRAILKRSVPAVIRKSATVTGWKRKLLKHRKSFIVKRVSLTQNVHHR